MKKPARRPSIRTRVQAALLAFVGAASLFAVLGVLALDRLGGAIATILPENYASVVACQDMKESLERLDSAAQFAASGRQDIGLPMLVTYRPQFDHALAREAANVTIAGEGEAVREITARYAAYVVRVDEVVHAPVATLIARHFSEHPPEFTNINDRIQAVLEMKQSAMVQPDRDARALARRTVRGAVVAALVGARARRLPRALDAARRRAAARSTSSAPSRRSAKAASTSPCPSPTWPSSRGSPRRSASCSRSSRRTVRARSGSCSPRRTSRARRSRA